jgi:glycosyltransferase involved in cell wall biosynthesis
MTVANPERRTPRPSCHLISSEYPPQIGGVSDYTSLLAAGLAEHGDEVHVWCPACPGALPSSTGRALNSTPGIVVHRQFGSFSPADLRRVGAELDTFPGPLRLLVQWVPHGFGYRSMNLGFCWWLWKRARQRGDRIELMVHEPFLSFAWASPRQSAAAFVHRWMTIVLLRAAARVWISIPGWERSMRAYALGRNVEFEWLPIFSNIPAASDPARTLAIRRQYADGNRLLIGHFGTFGSLITTLLDPILLALAGDPVEQTILLMGKGSDRHLSELIQKEPRLEGVIRATGQLSDQELSHHLSACDLLIQPYPDGVSTRRGSFMAGLANGKPIVTTTGWLTEPLWSQGDAVKLAPAGDTRAFLEQTRLLRQDPSARLRVGCAAGQLYRERFDISHTISSLRRTETTRDPECVFL